MTTRRRLLVIAVTALVSVSATVFAQRVFENEPAVAGATAVSMRSSVLDEDREYFVHLPESYPADSTTRYPVLYVLDGLYQSGPTAESAALLARIGVIPPMIIIGVPSMDAKRRNRDYTPPEMKLDTDAATSPMGAADRFHSFLKTELITRIERDYRTARPRMLAGYSRGGLFVIYSELLDPSLFDARFAHSPALWREDGVIVTRLQRALQARSLPRGFLYLSLGSEESDNMTGAFKHAVAVLEANPSPALAWRADFSAGGTHDSNPRLSTPVGLCAMFNVPAARSCRPNTTLRLYGHAKDPIE